MIFVVGDDRLERSGGKDAMSQSHDYGNRADKECSTDSAEGCLHNWPGHLRLNAIFPTLTFFCKAAGQRSPRISVNNHIHLLRQFSLLQFPHPLLPTFHNV